MSKKIGYAVVGLGVGKNHCRAAADSENAQLVAICDLQQSRLDEVKAEIPYVRTYTDLDEMLKCDDIDVVSVCVPSGDHANIAVRVLEAGKNVLVEKPIDITVEAAMKIEKARVSTRLKVGVVHQNRYNADMLPVRDAVINGRLGKLLFGDFTVKWFRTQDYYDNGSWRGTWAMDGGGSLMNQAVHTVDLMQWLMNSEVTSVTSKTAIMNHDIETEDYTASIITFKSGAIATFISTTCAYDAKFKTGIMLYGSNGSVECNGDILKTWKFTDNKDGEEEEMLQKFQGNGTAAAADPTLCVGHPHVVEDMICAVRDDRDPEILPLEAMKSVRIINAVYESSKTGKTIYFD